jgi:molecular chaperone DnaK
VKSRLDAAVERARKAHRGEDMAEVHSALTELTEAFSAAGQAIYAAQPAAGTEGAEAGGATPPKDDVVEADYEIVDDKK